STLEPEERQRIGGGASPPPARFVLLRMFIEIRGAYGAVGGEPLENGLPEPSVACHPRLGRPGVIPRRRQGRVEGAVLGRNNRRLVRPVFIEATFVPQEDVDQL